MLPQLFGRMVSRRHENTIDADLPGDIQVVHGITDEEDFARWQAELGQLGAAKFRLAMGVDVVEAG